MTAMYLMLVSSLGFWTESTGVLWFSTDSYKYRLRIHTQVTAEACHTKLNKITEINYRCFYSLILLLPKCRQIENLIFIMPHLQLLININAHDCGWPPSRLKINSCWLRSFGKHFKAEDSLFIPIAYSLNLKQVNSGAIKKNKTLE